VSAIAFNIIVPPATPASGALAAGPPGDALGAFEAMLTAVFGAGAAKADAAQAPADPAAVEPVAAQTLADPSAPKDGEAARQAPSPKAQSDKAQSDKALAAAKAVVVQPEGDEIPAPSNPAPQAAQTLKTPDNLPETTEKPAEPGERKAEGRDEARAEAGPGAVDDIVLANLFGAAAPHFAPQAAANHELPAEAAPPSAKAPQPPQTPLAGPLGQASQDAEAPSVQPSVQTLPATAAIVAPPAPSPQAAKPAPAKASQGEQGPRAEAASDGSAAPRKSAAVLTTSPASNSSPPPVTATAGSSARPDDATPGQAKAASAPEGDAPATTPAPAGAAAATAPHDETAVAPPLPVRGSPETVANLAAQILRKLGARSTQFDVQLDPAGLGRVNVRVEIGAEGRVSAAMSFDNPQAAADVKSRAAELQRALAQAGFDVSNGALSFDVAGNPDGRGQHQAFHEGGQNGSAFRGRAFAQALDAAGEAAREALRTAPAWSSAGPGLDLRI